MVKKKKKKRKKTKKNENENEKNENKSTNIRKFFFKKKIFAHLVNFFFCRQKRCKTQPHSGLRH